MREPVRKVKLLQPLDVDMIAIKRDHYFRNAYVIDFPLDSPPDHVWQDIFEGEWKSSRHLWDRKVFLMGDKLRLVTTRHDIADKVDWIKQVVEETNRLVDEYNKEAEIREMQTEEQARGQALAEERTNVDLIRETIRRRLGIT